MSMAAGEFVSVSSQSDTEQADVARERAELAAQPEFERRELAAIYVARGLTPELATQVAHMGTSLAVLRKVTRRGPPAISGRPREFAGYGQHFWGLTASDGPGWTTQRVRGIERPFFDYVARGAPYGPDDGTVAPWAAAASLPFAPETTARTKAGAPQTSRPSAPAGICSRTVARVEKPWKRLALARIA